VKRESVRRRGAARGASGTGSVQVARCLALSLALSLVLAGTLTAPRAYAGEFIPLSSAIGIRVSVVDTRQALLEADLDLTMYTRYPTASPSYPAGTPYFGIPALDYGDGSTVPTTTLALASSGGGPGGSNVYRSLASFTHSYPLPLTYTVTAGMFCTACFRGSATYFPAGMPGSPVFSTVTDYLPTSVIGNLAARYSYQGTTPSYFFPSYSVRYQVTLYGAVTNTTQVDLSLPVQVPTLSQWGLVALAVSLLAGGLGLLRRVG